MKIRDIQAKSILSKTGIYGVDYVINPYLGCSHGCGYCYADFMKRFHKGSGEWGSFVSAKVNAPEVLKRELEKIGSKKTRIMISSVCDPYQEIEKRYGLTRKCLEQLLTADKVKHLDISILTKSPLVLRDVDLLKKFRSIEVGMTITTDDDKVRKLFEPCAPSIDSRIDALKKMHGTGLHTYAFIGPILPMNAASLAEMLSGIVEYAFIDRMNYSWKTEKFYMEHKLEYALNDSFFEEKRKELVESFRKLKIPTKVLF